VKGLPGELRFRSLQGRLLWGTVFVLVLVMLAVTAVVEHRQREAIIGEVMRRGQVLAQNLAAMSYGPLLVYNFTALEQNVARVATETDVVYAIVVDAEGRVAAHSEEPERVGLPLEGPVDTRAFEADGPAIQETVAPLTGEAIFDFAVPVLVQDKKWGTIRVGLSKRRMEAEIRKTRRELSVLAAATLLLGGLAAALFARRIANPVRQLEERAAAIARGELTQRIEPRTFDEIGRLAAAFNHMAVQLGQQRATLQSVNAELQRRLGELEDVRSYTDSIVNSLTSGIVTVDLEGRVVTLNPVAELLTGFFRGEVAHRYCTELFADTPVFGEVLMETLTARAPIASVAVTLRRRSGALLPVELSTAPLKGGDGKDLGAVAVFRDLTVVRQLETQLRRTDRLAAVGTLAAGFAHEIKNPLTSLLTFSRLLTRRFDDQHFRERFQNVVPRELERINDIVERLLELARPSRLRFGLVRLPALVDRVIELYANQIEDGSIEVVRAYARDVPPIQADEEALYRAVVNLVTNALEAMPAGGRLTVRLRWGDEDLRPPRGQAFNRRVRLEVEDTGVGIAPADAERIFNPFFTTRDRGTGLGLALTNKIVADHGGAIDFRPVPAGGAIFRISLPLVPEPPPEPADEAQS
jgi:two-component system sensor histidine kinase AtoS